MQSFPIVNHPFYFSKQSGDQHNKYFKVLYYGQTPSEFMYYHSSTELVPLDSGLPLPSVITVLVSLSE